MQPEDLVGQTLGHYKIKRQIGYGGMATVFLADDIHLAREVALKVFWPRPGETQDFLRRFNREARVLARLDHPNILPVYDYGEQGEMAFLVTPYMAGGTLKDLLQKRKALPPSEAIQFFDQILPALQYAHDRNLIHRDIKPGNLLFKGDGSVVLADFGLVKVLESDGQDGIPLQTLSETGQSLAGTPEYMAPEQINGHAVAASDIYSLGIVLYEMLTGVRPFSGDTLLSVLLKHANESARPPRELNPYISPQLEAAILKALAKEPTRRFARPADFQQALLPTNNPVSQPGIAAMPDTDRPVPHAIDSQYSRTEAASWIQKSDPASQDTQRFAANIPNIPMTGYNQSPRPGNASAPTAANSQPGIVHSWQNPAQQVRNPASQPGLPSGNYPAASFPPVQPVQLWTQAQTVAPASLPQTRRRTRVPLVMLILCAIVAIVVAALFLTPLGAILSDFHTTFTPTLGTGLTTPGSGTQTGRGGYPSQPGSTLQMGNTTTSCPTIGSARPATMGQLSTGHDPTIVYIVDETDASGNPTYGTVKLFDTVDGAKTEIARTNQTRVTEAQVSNDGQWVLFSALVAGQSELRLVRRDGQGLQTLLCAPADTSIKSGQWSLDQRYVIFDEFPQNGEPTVYLLNIQTGTLQVEVTPPGSSLALVARTWLDNNRVLMVGMLMNANTSPQNIYILNIGNGARQHPASIAPVFTSTQACWDFDSSYDGKNLFITQCTPGSPTGSSQLSKQAAAGGTLSPILNSSTLALTTIRVIDPASSTLLSVADNTVQGNTGSQQNDGLYLLTTNGSGTPRLLTSTPAGATISLNHFSQYFWSNMSRDTTMYALETTTGNGNSSNYVLSYGQVSGGTPTAFTNYNQYMAIVGWATT